VAELVDARDSKSRSERSVGSTPSTGTIISIAIAPQADNLPGEGRDMPTPKEPPMADEITLPAAIEQIIQNTMPQKRLLLNLTFSKRLLGHAKKSASSKVPRTLVHGN
jgi:hypothetical protein